MLSKFAEKHVFSFALFFDVPHLVRALRAKPKSVEASRLSGRFLHQLGLYLLVGAGLNQIVNHRLQITWFCCPVGSEHYLLEPHVVDCCLFVWQDADFKTKAIFRLLGGRLKDHQVPSPPTWFLFDSQDFRSLLRDAQRDLSVRLFFPMLTAMWPASTGQVFLVMFSNFSGESIGFIIPSRKKTEATALSQRRLQGATPRTTWACRTDGPILEVFCILCVFLTVEICQL